MVNKVPFPVPEASLKANKEVIIEEAETQSISGYSSSSGSLGFGDFENGTIYDRIAELDAPDVGNSGTAIDSEKSVRTVVETVNLEKMNETHTDTKELEQTDIKQEVEAPKGFTRKKFMLIIVVLVISVVVGVVTALSTYFIKVD